MSRQGNPRRTRVGPAMRDFLARHLDREIRDPRIRAAGLVSVGHVELNRDMSVARVYVSFLGPGEHDDAVRGQAMTALAAAAGFLRGPLTRQLGLRRAPELRFVYDDTPAFGQRIHGMVRAQEPGPAAGPPDADADPGAANHDDGDPPDAAADPVAGPIADEEADPGR